MPRYEAEVTLIQKFVLAVEANDAGDAQTKAMSGLKDPVHTEMVVTVDQGVR